MLVWYVLVSFKLPSRGQGECKKLFRELILIQCPFFLYTVANNPQRVSIPYSHHHCVLLSNYNDIIYGGKLNLISLWLQH